MDDNLLLDAVERYRNGEMSSEEKLFFEELRKNNPEIDQAAAEHSFLLSELERMSEIKSLKNTLDKVESKLENEGFIELKEKKTKAKLIYLWNRYRRTITVAACIAGLVSISTASFVSLYSENKKSNALTPLVDNKIHQIEHKINQIENKLNDANTASFKPKFEANFRATGFLMDGDGYIITNAHVVNNAKNLIVENTKGEQFYAKPIYSNPLTDLAILRIIDSNFHKIPTLPYSFSKSSVDLAETVFTLGYPREEVVYGEGYVSAKSGYIGDTASYQISISANPGNSGGPVINKNGEIIGIISSKETNADGVVFAVKSKNIYTALKEINKKESKEIKLHSQNTLKGISRVQQIKKLQEFVYKVKGN
jgi:S1-C subfamily serine protease